MRSKHPASPEPPRPRRTIGTVLAETNGIAAGLDGVRVCLALFVVAAHQHTILYGRDAERGFLLELMRQNTLPVFFGVAGFIIAASSLRLSSREFAINRLLRIMPALAVEVVLSAFILGPIFTTLPLADYFSSPLTYTYLLNIVGAISFLLPGVFESNPSSIVNRSLWTIPFEYGAYILAFLAMLVGLNRRPLALSLIALAWAVVFQFVRLGLVGFDQPLPNRIIGWFGSPGSELIMYFLIGTAIYHWRHKIPVDARLAAAAAALASLAVFYPGVRAIAAVPVAYLGIYISLMRLPPIPLLRHGDYSYGIYLYGNPVQQAVRATLPGLDSYLLSMCVVLLLLLPFAMFSWHAIEKPFLHTRRRFAFLARARGVAGAGESVVGAPPPVVDPETGRVISYGSAQPPTRAPIETETGGLSDGKQAR